MELVGFHNKKYMKNSSNVFFLFFFLIKTPHIPSMHALVFVWSSFAHFHAHIQINIFYSVSIVFIYFPTLPIAIASLPAFLHTVRSENI